MYVCVCVLVQDPSTRMPIECLITFDNNSQGVYYAGQELSGVVDLSVDTTKRIKGKSVRV